MKVILTESLTFTPGAAGVGTIDFANVSGWDFRRLLAVINETRSGAVIYAPRSSQTAASVAGTVVTLGVDTTGHSGSDVLKAFYDLGTMPVSEVATILTGQAAQTAVVNNILPATAGASGTDVSNFRSASVQVTSTGTGGTFIFEQSNDGTNWVALPVYNAALVTGVPITTAITATASQIVYTFPVRCRLVRLRIATTITGGSIQAFSRISADPYAPAVFTVAQPTAASLLATVSGTVTANIGTGALAAGTNLIGDVGLQARANATGAATPSPVNSPATPASQSHKGTAGRVFGWALHNSSAGTRFVKVFNVAVPTLGTTSALYEIAIPAGQYVEVSFPVGIAHGTAIVTSVTSARGLTDNTATGLAATDITGILLFA